MERRSPTDVLFGAYHRRILSLLLLHPERSYYVREIARLAEVPPGSVHRELKRLAEVGLLRRESVGNQVRYQADRSCTIYSELAGIFRKTAGIVEVLQAALEPLRPAVVLAFVFGSVAHGTERESSDVDVCVVGSVSFADVVAAFADVHERLGREVNPVVMTKPDFAAKWAKGERFVTRIIQEGKLYLIGDADDFGELAEHRTAEGAHD